MPVEVKANFIRIRVEDPKQFARFAVKTLGKGIKAVIGFFKKGGSKIQSLLFPKSKYTVAEARAWAKSHKYTIRETFAVVDIDPHKDGEDMFIEYPITIEETEKTEIKKDSNYFLNLALKSIELGGN